MRVEIEDILRDMVFITWNNSIRTLEYHIDYFWKCRGHFPNVRSGNQELCLQTIQQFKCPPFLMQVAADPDILKKSPRTPLAQTLLNF
jgi:hypothetical protein